MRRRILEGVFIPLTSWTWLGCQRAANADGVRKINLRDIRVQVMSHRSHLPPSARIRPSSRRRCAVVCSFVPRPAGEQDPDAARPVLPSQYRFRRVHLLPRRRFLQPRQHQGRDVHAASARDSSRPASESAGQSAQENPNRRVRRNAGRFEPDSRSAGGASRWNGRNIGPAGALRHRQPSDYRPRGDSAAPGLQNPDRKRGPATHRVRFHHFARREVEPGAVQLLQCHLRRPSYGVLFDQFPRAAQKTPT